jgi:hypothetical protein
LTSGRKEIMTVTIAAEEVTSEGFSTSFTTVVRQVLWTLSDGRKFWASEAIVPFSGQEILVFPADEDGEVPSMIEVAGGRAISWEGAAESLLEYASE